MGENYDQYEAQQYNCKKMVIVRDPSYFGKIFRSVDVNELYQTHRGNLYFEYSFSASDLDRWCFELVEGKEIFLRKYTNNNIIIRQ